MGNGGRTLTPILGRGGNPGRTGNPGRIGDPAIRASRAGPAILAACGPTILMDT